MGFFMSIKNRWTVGASYVIVTLITQTTAVTPVGVLCNKVVIFNMGDVGGLIQIYLSSLCLVCCSFFFLVRIIYHCWICLCGLVGVFCVPGHM